MFIVSDTPFPTEQMYAIEFYHVTIDMAFINKQMANLIVLTELRDKELLKEVLLSITNIKRIICNGTYELKDYYRSMREMVSVIPNIQFAKNNYGKIVLSGNTHILLLISYYLYYCITFTTSHYELCGFQTN